MSTNIKNLLAASVVTLFSATSCGAHMILATPPPYGAPSNAPLEADGSNFPCKAASNSGGNVTTMAIGAQQQLSFLGESVHGGGSCQISLTTDNPATKNSAWMVIHSIEGGCPARNAKGNLGADDSASKPDPDTYNYSIPAGIKPGAYTLAWTWFNKVGNREMYMNCASIQVTGGTNKRDTSLNGTDDAAPELFDRGTPSFPSMFIANIPASDCTTTADKDVQFPDPGASVERPGVASDFAPPTGPKCGAAGAASSSSSSSSGSSSGSSAAPAAPSVAPAAAAAPSPSPAPPAAAAPSPAPAASPAAAAPAAPVDASSSGSSSGSACSSPGSLVCSPDGTKFAICPAGGATPIFQPVAAGTACKNGAIAAAKSKRSAKFLQGYEA